MAALVASVSLDPSAPSAATPVALIPQTHATATATAGKLLFVSLGGCVYLMIWLFFFAFFFFAFF
jgi:hypothetical protein